MPRAPRNAALMVNVDRPTVLESLDERHDDLLGQLEALNCQIEAALAATGALPAGFKGGEQKPA